MGRGSGSHGGGGHSGGRSFGGPLRRRIRRQQRSERSRIWRTSPRRSTFWRTPQKVERPCVSPGLFRLGWSGRRGGGCFTIIVLLILVIGLFNRPFTDNGSSQNSEITVSRTERTAVTGTTPYAEWNRYTYSIDHDTDLTDGLKYFYSQTGIQPYVVLLEYTPSIWINGKWNETAAEEYLAQMYNETFSDNGHLIFAYFACENDSEDMDGTFYLYYGSAAYSIMDSEAETIFWSYFDMNYNNLDLSIAEFIGQTFRQTADNIMHISAGGNKTLITTSVIFAVICVAVIIAGIVVVKKMNKKEKSL